jgi:membrane-associated phospholipid phosphatase
MTENFTQTTNLNIFKFFNQTFGKAEFNDVMIFADNFGGPYIFHYHLILIIGIASLLLFKKRKDKDSLKEISILGFSSICTLCISLILGLLISAPIKAYTEVYRPFCSLDNIYVLKEALKHATCNRSFPSGHMTFSIIMVTSFWPLFNKLFKSIAVIFICILGITRMSAGVHYPMDLLGAIALFLPLTLYIRDKILLSIKTYEAKHNIFDRLYKLLENIN